MHPPPRPLPHPSVSPLWSFASIPTIRRSPSTMEMVRAVWRWLTGRRRAPSLKQRFREQRLIDEIIALESQSPSRDLRVAVPPGEGG
jgi:hypothetical protein